MSSFRSPALHLESSSRDEICGLLQHIHRPVQHFFYWGGRRPDLLPQQLVIPSVLEDVLCGLFCFSTRSHGGWHKAESIMHVLVQLVVPSSQMEDDHLFWP